MEAQRLSYNIITSGMPQLECLFCYCRKDCFLRTETVKAEKKPPNKIPTPAPMRRSKGKWTPK